MAPVLPHLKGSPHARPGLFTGALVLRILLPFLLLSTTSVSAEINGHIYIGPNQIPVTFFHSKTPGRNLSCRYNDFINTDKGPLPITVNKIEWLQNGRFIGVQASHHYLTGLDMAETGNYTCRITYTYTIVDRGVRNTSEASVEVFVTSNIDDAELLLRPQFFNTQYQPESKPRSRITYSAHLLQVGSEFTLDCRAWSRLPSGIDYRMHFNGAEVNRNAALQISYVRLVDAGIWSCRAVNKHGSITHVFNITVELGTNPAPSPTTTPPRTSLYRTTSPVVPSTLHSHSASPTTMNNMTETVSIAEATLPATNEYKQPTLVITFALAGISLGLFAILVSNLIAKARRKPKVVLGSKEIRHVVDAEQRGSRYESVSSGVSNATDIPSTHTNHNFAASASPSQRPSSPSVMVGPQGSSPSESVLSHIAEKQIRDEAKWKENTVKTTEGSEG